MSALIRKDIIEAEGGLKTFGKYLAEDYFIAQAIQKRGLYTVSQDGFRTEPSPDRLFIYFVGDFVVAGAAKCR